MKLFWHYGGLKNTLPTVYTVQALVCQIFCLYSIKRGYNHKKFAGEFVNDK